jgi:pantoate--beta-alanine ligase
MLRSFLLSLSRSQVRCLHIIKTIEEMHQFRKELYQKGEKIVGFVPTMGALHEGHLHLMTKARSYSDLVIASIFVNPTQFSAGEDLDRYPRQVETDIHLMKRVGVDILFLPDQMYETKPLCHVEPLRFSQISEGVARPEFFRGVATIVAKLFNIVRPDVALFGQKDISQCILIQNMVKDLNIPTTIKVIETVRESDGLAMSSRNAYLKSHERPFAKILYQALLIGSRLIEEKKIVQKEEIVHVIEEALQSETLVSKIEYISIASHINMEELEKIDAANGCVISSAIRLGNVRLIDNVLVGKARTDILSE